MNLHQMQLTVTKHYDLDRLATIQEVEDELLYFRTTDINDVADDEHRSLYFKLHLDRF